MNKDKGEIMQKEMLIIKFSQIDVIAHCAHPNANTTMIFSLNPHRILKDPGK